MKEKEFYDLVHAESLYDLDIGDTAEARGVSNTVGYYEEDNKWIIYENDERAMTYTVSAHESAEKMFEALLDYLRNRKKEKTAFSRLFRQSRG